MEIDLNTSLKRKYNLRFAKKKTKEGYESLEITVPLEVAERECRRLGMTTEEFADKYDAVWYLGNHPGLYLAFEEKEKTPAAEVSPATAGVEPGR